MFPLQHFHHRKKRKNSSDKYKQKSKVYAIGGLHSSIGHLSTVEEYDPGT
ncbi:MAG: kelch repeat-containing protein [Candidatus Edwardsbacteria bacterium]